ncbi:ankyrin repeat containing protein YAR1 [Metarhizium brunneum]
MAPTLSEDEIDDLIYLARVGENDELKESLAALAEREKVSHAEILIAAKDEGKSTALHMATGNGHLETVRELLRCFDGRPKEEKQAFIDEANEHGNTGLHWAALGGHLDTVKLLMDYGASPALANERNYVPLDLANFNDKREVAEYFLESAGMLENNNEESGLANAAESIELAGDEDDREQGEAA